MIYPTVNCSSDVGNPFNRKTPLLHALLTDREHEKKGHFISLPCSIFQVKHNAGSTLDESPTFEVT